MKDRQVAAACRGIVKRPHLALKRFVYRERVQLGIVSEAPEQIANPARAVADRVAFVRRRNPLVDDHVRCAAGLRT